MQNSTRRRQPVQRNANHNRKRLKGHPKHCSFEYVNLQNQTGGSDWQKKLRTQKQDFLAAIFLSLPNIDFPWDRRKSGGIRFAPGSRKGRRNQHYGRLPVVPKVINDLAESGPTWILSGTESSWLKSFVIFVFPLFASSFLVVNQAS